MGHIYKYEMIRRGKNILIIGGVMLGMTLISVILSLALHLSAYRQPAPTYATIWLSLTILAIVMIPIVMFFTCCHAHINELLFKDTNYLMLTIPVASWKILLGRWLAGLSEYLIYIILSLLCFVCFALSLTASNVGHVLQTIKSLFISVTGNTSGLFILLAYFLALFALVGMTIITVNIIIRSLIKKRKLTTAISIIVCIFLFFLLNDFATWMSDQLNWVSRIKLTGYIYDGTNIISEPIMIPIHMVVPIIWTVLAAAFFFVSSWLLEKKVEV